MAEFKVVLSDPKTAKAYNLTVAAGQAGMFIGKKIGDEIDAGPLGLSGYGIKITGGTDRVGTPARADLPGMGRRGILLAGGVGFKPGHKGLRRRKSVRGSEITADFVQVNTVITKSGEKPLDTFFGKAEGKKEEKPEENKRTGQVS
ncbi:MAG: 30S ribosomal protein S6e [Methanomicrobiales archaeon]|nr:30S ribosomal protein S6e [Methanomicrobiales archaeon]